MPNDVNSTVRLTSTAKAAGCAAKLSPSVLETALKKLPAQHDPNCIVGFETSDDAAVYRLSPDLAIVETVDFFTPIVDDPFEFGQVAATNALSDIYAMGGRPLCSLTILAFPAEGDPAVLEQVLCGGLSKMCEAHCTVVGGHSVRDEELKFGYAVTGTIHPDKIWKNVGAQPGDALILTKALGTGVISSAIKQQKAPPAWIAAATTSMTTLNRDAADALHDLEAAHLRVIHAVTDVTGFGLLGHAREMALASRVTIEINHKNIAWLDGAIDAARGGYFSAGMKNNREFVAGCADFAPGVPDEFRALVVDPQTSGGLLVAISPTHASLALAAFKNRQVEARIIGSVKPKGAHLLFVA